MLRRIYSPLARFFEPLSFAEWDKRDEIGYYGLFLSGNKLFRIWRNPPKNWVWEESESQKRGR